MFCIRSDVITLGSIEMYGLVTIWTSMDDGPYRVILLMYGSHDMRHIGFRRLTVVNGTPGFWGFTDPLTYCDVMDDSDKEKCQDAMNQEMESMYSNSVWELVDPPEDVRPIGCKWIFKRKRGIDGKVETLKARLVAKGYTQKEGVDYEETFSLVAMLKSFRILLSIDACLDYEIWKMDVKMAFLNGYLEESIYMMQP